ncbi:MAG: hypothetical protein DCC49_04685 [Acidobacteria bacterium]|nr:MAG: hypothetical protein DCC49_04685 [Acidobacteriota bacterium]
MLTYQGALTQTIRYGYSGPIDSHSYTAGFSGAVETANWSGPTGLIATASTSGQVAEIAYHYFDQRGDTRAIADGAGAVGFQANYSEYGEITSQSSQLPQYGFVGAHKRITNPATGLIHMGARMYQPKLGRFLSRDPITGGSANDYEYTSGDPINRIDVSGTHHICTVYPNPNCQTSPEVDRVICEQGIAAGVQEIIDAACHFGDAGDGRGIGRGANGTYFIIDTRTGQIIARDLGRSDVTRHLASRNAVNWASSGSRWQKLSQYGDQ